MNISKNYPCYNVAVCSSFFHPQNPPPQTKNITDLSHFAETSEPWWSVRSDGSTTFIAKMWGTTMEGGGPGLLGCPCNLVTILSKLGCNLLRGRIQPTYMGVINVIISYNLFTKYIPVVKHPGIFFELLQGWPFDIPKFDVAFSALKSSQKWFQRGQDLRNLMFSCLIAMIHCWCFWCFLSKTEKKKQLG